MQVYNVCSSICNTFKKTILFGKHVRVVQNIRVIYVSRFLYFIFSISLTLSLPAAHKTPPCANFSRHSFTRKGMPKTDENLRRGGATSQTFKNLNVIKWMEKEEVLHCMLCIHRYIIGHYNPPIRIMA